MFGCLGAFVGLVGLYACIVRRLRTEERNRRPFSWLYWLGWLSWVASLLLLLFVVCLGLLLGLLRSCCLWVSLGLLAFLFPFG